VTSSKSVSASKAASQAETQRLGEAILPKRYTKTSILGIRLKAADRERLDVIARINNQTVAELVRGTLSAAMWRLR
jgi:hypothetical protein